MYFFVSHLLNVSIAAYKKAQEKTTSTTLSDVLVFISCKKFLSQHFIEGLEWSVKIASATVISGASSIQIGLFILGRQIE